MDVARTFELLADVPAGKTVVSESGIRSREQVEELERVGVDAVLIGETLMRSEDPEAGLPRPGRDRGGHDGLADSRRGRATPNPNETSIRLQLSLSRSD